MLKVQMLLANHQWIYPLKQIYHLGMKIYHDLIPNENKKIMNLDMSVGEN